MTVDLFGYQISNVGVDGDTEWAMQAISARRNGSYMACANPHSLVVASKDKIFRQALKESDILLPDGSGIVLAATALNLGATQKVAGTDFFLELSRKCNEKKNVRFFFLGSSEKVLSLLIGRFSREFPHVEVCGSYSPPYKAVFSEVDNQAMAEAINRAKPDVVWVGMTAPKQEKWIFENRERLHVPFLAAIGAVFDFYAGTKKRSSAFWVRLGLEWLPRFVKEPRRLWERNLKSTPIFLWWVTKEKLRRLV